MLSSPKSCIQLARTILSGQGAPDSRCFPRDVNEQYSIVVPTPNISAFTSYIIVKSTQDTQLVFYTFRVINKLESIQWLVSRVFDVFHFVLNVIRYVQAVKHSPTGKQTSNVTNYIINHQHMPIWTNLLPKCLIIRKFKQTKKQTKQIIGLSLKRLPTNSYI